MFKSILLCLEGSRSSQAATRACIQIARESQATITGMAIVDRPDIEVGAAMGIGNSAFQFLFHGLLVAHVLLFRHRLSRGPFDPQSDAVALLRSAVVGPGVSDPG